MSIPAQIAKHYREVIFGGNWTSVNLKDSLAQVNWQMATNKVKDLNTIATLVYHVHYYVRAALQVIQGGPLEAHDKFSFSHPPINNEAGWQQLLEATFREAEQFAQRVEQLPAEKLLEHFADPKYGSWYRNLHGIIEHTHYHLGQIVLMKKLLAGTAA